MTETFWYVLVTLVLALPVTDGGTEKQGDIIESSLMGAALTKEKCESGAAILADILTEQGGGSVIVATDCIEMDAQVAEIKGFEPIDTPTQDLLEVAE